MAIDANDPIFHTPDMPGLHPELMLSAVLHLMSHYTANAADNGGCVKLASVIERHLKALAALPGLAPVLSATCQQLSEQWAAVVDKVHEAFTDHGPSQLLFTNLDHEQEAALRQVFEED